MTKVRFDVESSWTRMKLVKSIRGDKPIEFFPQLGKMAFLIYGHDNGGDFQFKVTFLNIFR